MCLMKVTTLPLQTAEPMLPYLCQARTSATITGMVSTVCVPCLLAEILDKFYQREQSLRQLLVSTTNGAVMYS